MWYIDGHDDSNDNDSVDTCNRGSRLCKYGRYSGIIHSPLPWQKTGCSSRWCGICPSRPYIWLWCICTSYLIAKGLEGFICGLIAEKVSGRKGRIIGTVVGGVIMVTGYFIGEIFMYGLKTSAAAVPANSMQALFGIVTSLIIYVGVSRAMPRKK